MCMQHSEETLIFKNQTFFLGFGDIVITSKDGVETNRGWGINFYNYKGKPDKGYVFNYCPYCGEKIKVGTNGSN